MKHPVAYQKCIEEINRFDNEGLLSSPIKYGEASFQLSYTCACIKEAARIFPAFAIHMGRVAPPEGLELSGYYIPAGYRVAMNAAIVHRDRALFGPDADEFKPERWMDGQSRTKELGKGMLLFGAGTRTCSGKFVSITFWLDL
jgi:cytochrome P450